MQLDHRKERSVDSSVVAVAAVVVVVVVVVIVDGIGIVAGTGLKVKQKC